MNIHLLHTNDVHSHLENYMRLGAVLRRVRDETRHRGETVLTFDIGDVIDRVRPETDVTLGLVNAAMMAALGYDGWVFGNNEGLTIPVALWPELVARAETTLFAANFQPTGSQVAVVGRKDWTVYGENGVRIGVFGLTANYDKPYEHLDVEVLPPFHRAREAVAALQSEGSDVIIALSHLGLWDDRKLAKNVPGIDVILGGHSHHFMTEAEWVGHTAIFQAGKHGLCLGHTKVVYDPATRRVDDVVSESIEAGPHTPPDTAMLSAYRAYLPDVERHLDEPLATLSEALALRYDRESPFANLLVDALFAAYPCDIGIMMSGALNASLLPGVVLRRHLLGACSTPTRPLLMTLSGKDIVGIVEKGMDSDHYLKKGMGFGFRGSVVGWLTLANTRATVEQDAVGRLRVSALYIGGQPIDLTRMYRVVTCEYLWLAPVFEEFHRGTDIDIRPRLVREVLEEQFNNETLFRCNPSVRYDVVGQKM